MDYSNKNGMTIRPTVHNANRVAEFEQITRRATAKSEIINNAIGEAYNILASYFGPTLSVDVSGDTLQEIHHGSFVGDIKANVSCVTANGFKRAPVSLPVKASKLFIAEPAKFITAVKASVDTAKSTQDEQVNKVLASIDQRIAEVKAEADRENNIAAMMNDGKTFEEADKTVTAQVLSEMKVEAAAHDESKLTVADASQFNSMAEMAPIITLSELDGVPNNLTAGTIIPFGGCEYEYLGKHKSASGSTDGDGNGYDFRLVIGTKASLNEEK